MFAAFPSFINRLTSPHPISTFSSIRIDNIAAYACAVPDLIAEGITVTDEALEASGSVVINCINRDKKNRKRRRKAMQTVPVRFDVTR